MPVVYPTTNVITTGIAITSTTTTYSISNGDTLIIGEPFTVGSTDSIAVLVRFDTFNARIDGHVFGDVYGLDLNGDGTTNGVDYSISVGETGTIFSRIAAIVAGAGTSSQTEESTLTVSNDGEVISDTWSAVYLYNADTAAFQNAGIVRSLNTDSGYGNGVWMYGVNEAIVTNSGLIESASTSESHPASAAVIYSFGTENAVLTNSGTISAPRVALYSDATVSESFTNSGTMIGDLRLSRTVGGELENTGTIEGNVFTYGGDDYLFNAGLILGDVVLGGGNDTYRAFADGALSGEVRGGSGHDTINGGSLADALRGENGDDVVRGRNGDDDLWGDGGDDLLAGGGGDDELRGGAGDDRLRGGSGNDDVLGGSGDDVLGGGAGDDVIQGASGEDSLRGSDGRDILIGGRDADILVGGADADTFVWEEDTDAGSSFAQSDVIRDFERGLDVIDIGQLASEDFIFRGTNGLRGNGNAEVSISVNSGNSFVRIDVDGDGTRDLQIIVEDVIGLTANDFVL